MPHRQTHFDNYGIWSGREQLSHDGLRDRVAMGVTHHDEQRPARSGLKRRADLRLGTGVSRLCGRADAADAIGGNPVAEAPRHGPDGDIGRRN
jgi:hypothetical protein